MEYNYSVGDKIRIRSDLVVGRCYGRCYFVEEMRPFLGEIVTITKVTPWYVRIGSGPIDWGWSSDMIDTIIDSDTPLMRLRDDLKPFRKYGGLTFVPPMDKIKGQKVYIRVGTDRVRLGGFWVSREMLVACN